MFPVTKNAGLQTITRGIGMFPIIWQSQWPKSFFSFQSSTEQPRYTDSESLLCLNSDEDRNKNRFIKNRTALIVLKLKSLPQGTVSHSIKLNIAVAAGKKVPPSFLQLPDHVLPLFLSPDLNHQAATWQISSINWSKRKKNCHSTHFFTQVLETLTVRLHK